MKFMRFIASMEIFFLQPHSKNFKFFLGLNFNSPFEMYTEKYHQEIAKSRKSDFNIIFRIYSSSFLSGFLTIKILIEILSCNMISTLTGFSF